MNQRLCDQRASRDRKGTRAKVISVRAEFLGEWGHKEDGMESGKIRGCLGCAKGAPFELTASTR